MSSATHTGGLKKEKATSGASQGSWNMECSDSTQPREDPIPIPSESQMSDDASCSVHVNYISPITCFFHHLPTKWLYFYTVLGMGDRAVRSIKPSPPYP